MKHLSCIGLSFVCASLFSNLIAKTSYLLVVYILIIGIHSFFWHTTVSNRKYLDSLKCTTISAFFKSRKTAWLESILNKRLLVNLTKTGLLIPTWPLYVHISSGILKYHCILTTWNDIRYIQFTISLLLLLKGVTMTFITLLQNIQAAMPTLSLHVPKMKRLSRPATGACTSFYFLAFRCYLYARSQALSLL